MDTIKIHLLGDVSVTSPDGDRHVVTRLQARAVLALLVLDRPRAIGRHEVAELLWGPDLPVHWTGAVRGVMAKLRAFLRDSGQGATRLTTTAEGWQLEVPPGTEVDLEESLNLLAGAEQVARSDRSPVDSQNSDSAHIEAAAERAAQAADMLALGFAPGAPGEWVERRRRLVEHHHRRALELAARLGLEATRTDIALIAAEALSELDPFDETAAGLLAEAFLQSGDRRGARDHLTRFRRRLRDELDVELAAELEDLLQATGPAEPTAAPSSLTPVPRSPLFGRGEELDRLWSTWQTVVSSGTARLGVVTGEPGSGKTRLLTELARSLEAEGKPVLWSSCSPDGRTSFEPLLTAFPALADHGSTFAVPLASSRSETSPAYDEPAWSGLVSTRAELFGAVASILEQVLDRPTLWVLDDLQWTDQDTADALAHMARDLARAPVHLLVATRGHPRGLATVLEHLSRAMPSETIHLRGLDRGAVQEMLAHAGVGSSEELGSRVHERTGGNPFFITQLLDEWDGTADLDPSGMPGALRSWIDHRLDALEPRAASVLAAASVSAGSLDVDLLAAMTGLEALTVSEDLDSLVRQGFLTQLPRGDHGIYFSHALTREAVLHRVGEPRRQILNAAAAAWLDEGARGGAATVARHLRLSGDRRHRDPVEVELAAGDDELRRGAWATALAWFEPVATSDDALPDLRIKALIGAGRARRGLGDRAGARVDFRTALDGARSIEASRLFAEAALGLVGGGARGVSDDMADQERATLLRAALGPLGEADDDLVIPLQLELAVALLLTDRVQERDGLVRDSVGRARHLDRPDLLGSALLATRIADLDPNLAETRLDVVQEVLALPKPVRSPELTVQALVGRHEDLLLIGDRARAREALAESAEVVSRWPHPYWRWVVATWQVLELIIDGDLEAAESGAIAAVELQADHPESVACLGVNLVDIRLFQGRAGEVVDLLTGAADDNPQIPCYRAVLALCLAEAGDLEAARRELAHFADSGFANIPHDTNRLLTLAALADLCATLADVESAIRIEELLSPHAGRQVILNCYAGGGAYWGPVDTQLARLAALCGSPGAAEIAQEAQSSAYRFCAPLAAERVPDLRDEAASL